MKALIHFARIGKPEVLYTENLMQDDGTRLDTCSFPSPETARIWSVEQWQKGGFFKEDQFVYEVRKHHFYQQWFGIMQLYDAGGELLGTYCDILTPLERRNGEYYLLDLFLDLWIYPDGRYRELDWDEFDEAFQKGLLSVDLREKAIETLRRLVFEVQQGIFPANDMTIKK